jgi:hypothetical protein
MKTISKKVLLIISGIAIAISIAFPFFIASENDSFLTVFSVSLSMIGIAMTLIAMYIAIVLYQKFGLESKFIERRTDKVLELVDLLKGKTYTISTKKFKYFLRFRVEDYKKLREESFYKYMKNMIVLMDKDDYVIGTKKNLNLRNSYWLPSEIKDKLDFFRLIGTSDIEIKEKDEKYARLSFNSEMEESKKWVVTFPQFTVDDYIKRKNELSIEIIKWLSNHCDIKLDLKLDEPNQVEENLS